MRWFVVVLAGAATLFAQQGTPLAPEVLQLAKIRQRMLANLARQPNYTCVETVERSHRPAPTRKFQMVDTIRLEVALVEGKEMFGWPGAKKFEETDLRNLVSTGAIGNGNFANHARAIFGGSNATFDFRGSDAFGIRYDFRVPLMLSGYKLRTQKGDAIVGYHGSIWADPDSLDVRRLEVFADDIPAQLGLATAADRMDYARLKIGDGDFLLPAFSELSMVDLNGSENRNQVRFTSCRQFSGESVLTFGDAPPPDVPPAPVAESDLPPDLSLRLTLLDDVELGKSAVGDPVRARLENDLRHKGKLLFARGATVSGRITQMERHDDYTDVGLEFSEIESPGSRAHLKVRLQDVIGLDPFALHPRGLKTSPDSGERLIPLSPTHPRLSHGILMFWRT